LLGASGCGKTTLLSCIVGMMALNGGEMSVLGCKTRANELQKAGSRIGFMPQENALVGELTIKETIYFFGRIYGIDIKKLKERYEMLKNVLELPCDSQKVENCSGGEQRRVSIAAAMIHEPDLVILDEPIVGLDPILRQSIWNFMLEVTRTNKMTIIITTHYIEEAKQADRVGVMSNGVLLSEESPQNILSRHECENLEMALVKLCRRQKNAGKTNIEMIISETSEMQVTQSQRVEQANSIRWFIIKSLMTKSFIQFKRQPV